MAHIRQSGSNSGVVLRVKVLETFEVVPSSLESGSGKRWRGFRPSGAQARVTLPCVPVCSKEVAFSLWRKGSARALEKHIDTYITI